MSPFKYSEHLLAQELGMSREELKEHRDAHLRQGEHWKREHGQIAINATGLRVLWQLLKVPRSAFDLSRCLVSEKNGAPIRMPAPIDKTKPMLVTVTRVYPNPYMLQAAGERAGDGPYEVRVPSNLVWTVHDKILIGPDATNPGFYRLFGPAPRFKADRTYPLRLQTAVEKK
jgi:hypothetical protein